MYDEPVFVFTAKFRVTKKIYVKYVKKNVAYKLGSSAHYQINLFRELHSV